MKIEFNSLRISNFMSLGEATIELNDQGYVTIAGYNENPTDNAKSNGAGKSSIFEAIVWCLTGNTIRGNKNVTNIYGNDGALVTLDFTCDGHKYVVIRSKDNSKYKTNLFIYVDGENKSGKGIRDSEAILKEYLPDLTPSLIGSVIILGQGLPQKFTSNTPSGRKDVLEKLSKSDFMIEDLKIRITNRKLELSTELRKIEDNILKFRTQIDIENTSINNNQQELITLQRDSNYDAIILEQTKFIDAEDKCIQELTTQYDELNQQYEEIQKNLRTLDDKEHDERYCVDTSYKDLFTEIRDRFNNICIEEESVKKELKRILSITDVCPTCGQKLIGVKKPDSTILQEQLKQIEDTKAKCSKEFDDLKATYNQDIKNVELKYYDKKSELLIKIDQTQQNLRRIKFTCDSHVNSKTEALSMLTKYQTIKETYEQNILKLDEAIKESMQKIDSLNKDITKYSEQKESVEIRQGIINKFNTIITRDFRGYLLTNVLEFINKTAKEYTKCVFGTELIEVVLDGNNISITYDGKEYEALSGGEKQKIDLIIQFSIRDMLCKTLGFFTNILVLDEIFDNLDSVGCSKVIDLISQKLNDINSIFIITHHGSDLSIPSDKVIQVVKDINKISMVK